jgi:hypothetical protein
MIQEKKLSVQAHKTHVAVKLYDEKTLNTPLCLSTLPKTPMGVGNIVICVLDFDV